MARTKQHPNIGRFAAAYVGENSTNDGPFVFDTAEEALEAFRESAEFGQYEDGAVVYVYAIVGVKTIRKPTLTENFVE